MVQHLDPDADVALNGWTDPGNGTTNVWQNMADASDASYAKSSSNPDGTLDSYTVSLEPGSDVASPASNDCTFQVRYRKVGGKGANLSVQLTNGASTVREGLSAITPGTAWNTSTYNTLDSLSWAAGELADARVDMTPLTSGGGSPTDVEVAFLFFEVPDGGPGAQTITPTGISTAETFGTAVLTTGPVTVTPSGIGSTEAFGTATVTAPPPSQTITVTAGIATAEALGSPTITPGAVTLTPSGIASGEAFGTTVVSPGSVTITPTGVASTEAFGTAVVRVVQTVAPTGIGSAEALGTPTLTTGAATIAPSGVVSAEAFGIATVSGGSTVITPTGIASLEALGSPTITTGAVSLAPTGIPTGEAFGTATLSLGGAPPQTISPTGIPAPTNDELVDLGFNGDFETTISPWYAAGPAGGTVTRDTTESVTGSASLKLVHGSLGGDWSEAGDDSAFANGAGSKRISFWMKSSQAQPEVQVWPFFGSAPLDWADSVTLRFPVTTEWQLYEGVYEQTLPMHTGLYFDQMTAGGAVAGTTLWVEDIVIEGTPTVTVEEIIAPTGIPAPGDEPGISELGSEWNTTLDTDLAQWGAVGGTIARVTTGTYEGAGAAELTHGTDPTSAAFLYKPRTTPVTAGPNRLIVAMRADSERQVRVDLFDSTYTEDHFTTFTVGTEWAEYEFDLDLLSGDIIEADFTQYTALGAGAGTKLYIDSLELRPLTAFGRPAVTTGPVGISVTGIPDETAFGQPHVRRTHKRVLRNPTVEDSYLDVHGRPNPWGVELNAGVTLLKIDGVYHQVRWPTDDDIAAASVVYRGGFENEVTEEEVADLTAAGYGAYIQLIPA